jgi:hypothetical protein
MARKTRNRVKLAGYGRHVRRLLERGECHPSWGKKRLAKIAKSVDRKEKQVIKRIATKHRSPKDAQVDFTPLTTGEIKHKDRLS